MKKVFAVLMVLTVLACAIALAACNNEYTVTFAANYAGGEDVSMLLTKGSAVEFPILQRAGYALVGWYTDAECITPVATIDGRTPLVKGDVTYYAKWQPDGSTPDSGNDGQGGDVNSGNGGQSGETGNTPAGEDNGSSTGNNTGNDPANGDDNGQGGSVVSAPYLISIDARYAGTPVAGALFDKQAITVTATYSDSSSHVVGDYTLAQQAAAVTSGAHTVDVIYSEGTVTARCAMAYTVAASAVVTHVDSNLYFTNIKGWSTVNAYLWRGDGADAVSNSAWPGDVCRLVETNGYGQTVYAIDLAGGDYQHVIFNSGSGEQTEDIALSDDCNGYYIVDDGDFWKDGAHVFKVNSYQYAAVGAVTTYVFDNLGDWAKDGKKKVYIYTPADYDATADKLYKVLYMFDGQNLFDGTAANGRSWGVNSTLAAAGVDCIVVGVDNGEEGVWRDKQLTMSESGFGSLSALTHAGEKYGMSDETANYRNGTLNVLGDFIRNTLMPYINSHYKVLTGRENTLLAGSSSGGLAAFYLGLRDSDLYSVVGAFSPATGLFDLSTWKQYLIGDAALAARAYPQAMYIYCGYGNPAPADGESWDPQRYDYGDVLENDLYDYGATAGASKLQALLSADGVGYLPAGEIVTVFTENATHNEGAWRTAFVRFVTWAFNR